MLGSQEALMKILTLSTKYLKSLHLYICFLLKSSDRITIGMIYSNFCHTNCLQVSVPGSKNMSAGRSMIHLHPLIVASFMVLCTAMFWHQAVETSWPMVAAAVDVAENRCINQRCGDIDVSYPFTLASWALSCPHFNHSPHFELNCTDDLLFLNNASIISNHSTGAPLQVLNITADSLILNITSFQSSFSQSNFCRASAGDVNTSNSPALSPYMMIGFQDFPCPFVMATDNKFVSFGCGMLGELVTQPANGDTTDLQVGGCDAVCDLGVPNQTLTAESNSCSQMQSNCCISDFPESDVRIAVYQTSTAPGITDNMSRNLICQTFAVPFYDDSFSDFEREVFSLRVLWALPSQEAKNYVHNGTADDLPGSLCDGNRTAHVNVVSSIPGYTCSCSAGYQGDGYADGKGCTDINECRIGANDCVEGLTRCENTVGDYTCHCKSRWRVGDGRRSGSGCRFSPTLKKVLASVGASVGLLLAVLGIVWLNIVLSRRRRKKYFLQNGGFELQKYIAAGTGREATRFFSLEEVKEATQSFAEKRKLGSGGFGTVYKGELKGGRLVAVKKARLQADKQFLNEMAILTQINHRHIVRLLGCCLETASPLLVYEFVSNGDLRQHLEQQPGSDNSGSTAASPDWATRLRIAVQVADALAYLHAAASPPILHRDVKPANILLDDNMDAKLADFGVSRLVPDGDAPVSTAVQGTIGYLDPEYFQTLQLTDRSDVYSFGVVLVELITGLKAVDCRSRDSESANLGFLFVRKMREGQLEDLLDARLDADVAEKSPADERRQRASITGVAKLAWRCLAIEGAGRPSMSEVLEALRRNLRSLQMISTGVLDKESEDVRLSLLDPKEACGVDADAALMGHDATSSSWPQSLDASFKARHPATPR